MKAIWNGVVLAESDDTVVVEGNHYPEPSRAAEMVRGRVAFWRGVRVVRSVEASGSGTHARSGLLARVLGRSRALRRGETKRRPAPSERPESHTNRR